MPKYRATVQVCGLTGENPRAVRAALNEQLRQSGLQNCGVVAIDIDAPPRNKGLPAPRATLEPVRRRRADTGGLLLVAAAAWAICFFWWMLAASTE